MVLREPQDPPYFVSHGILSKAIIIGDPNIFPSLGGKIRSKASAPSSVCEAKHADGSSHPAGKTEGSKKTRRKIK